MKGLTKLTWASKNIVEFYVKDCCAHCAETHSIVKRFKDGKDGIARNCRFGGEGGECVLPNAAFSPYTTATAQEANACAAHAQACDTGTDVFMRFSAGSEYIAEADEGNTGNVTFSGPDVRDADAACAAAP